MNKLCVVVGSLLLAVPVYAEKIPIRDGTIDFHDNILEGDALVHIEGRYFSFNGRAMSARVDAADCAYYCEPGETMSLSAYMGGLDLPGIVTWKGEQYAVGDIVGINSLELEIYGRTTLPRIGEADTKTRTIRCRVEGEFTHGEIPLPLQTETLVGSAIATITLTKYDDDWILTGLVYDLVRR